MMKNIVETLCKKSSSFYYYHLDSTEYSQLTIYDCGYEKFSMVDFDGKIACTSESDP